MAMLSETNLENMPPHRQGHLIYTCSPWKAHGYAAANLSSTGHLSKSIRIQVIVATKNIHVLLLGRVRCRPLFWSSQALAATLHSDLQVDGNSVFRCCEHILHSEAAHGNVHSKILQHVVWNRMGIKSQALNIFCCICSCIF